MRNKIILLPIGSSTAPATWYPLANLFSPAVCLLLIGCSVPQLPDGVLITHYHPGCSMLRRGGCLADRNRHPSVHPGPVGSLRSPVCSASTPGFCNYILECHSRSNYDFRILICFLVVIVELQYPCIRKNFEVPHV